jgi:hypothetical protein
MNSKKFPQVKIDKQNTTIEVPHTYLKRMVIMIFRLLLSMLLSGSTRSLPPEHPPTHPPIDQTQ